MKIPKKVHKLTVVTDGDYCHENCPHFMPEKLGAKCQLFYSPMLGDNSLEKDDNKGKFNRAQSCWFMCSDMRVI